MKELIIGASGLVGSYLYRAALKDSIFNDVTGTYYSEYRSGLLFLDFKDANAVKRLIDLKQPDIVYLPAAEPHVDWCERQPEASAAINVRGPLNVIRALTGTATKLLFYSSDYVFDGCSGPYVEEDPPNPVNIYGRQKLIIENEIRNNLDNYLILRVTVVYGWEYAGKNFGQRVLYALRKGESVSVPVDQIGNPTYVVNLAEASRELARSKHTGVFHLAGARMVSRYEFAAALATIFGLDTSLIKPVTTVTAGQVARRPLKAGLVINKARRVLRSQILDHTEGLRQMKKDESSDRCGGDFFLA